MLLKYTIKINGMWLSLWRAHW